MPAAPQPQAEKPRRRRKEPDAGGAAAAAPPAQPPPPAAQERQEVRAAEQRPVAMARPQTARKAPPKIRSNEVPVEEGTARPSRGGPREQASASVDSAANAPNVIGENDVDLDEDDGMIIEAPGGDGETAAAAAAGAGGHAPGALVRNFQAAAQPVAAEEKAKEAEKKTAGGGIILTRKINSSNTEVRPRTCWHCAATSFARRATCQPLPGVLNTRQSAVQHTFRSLPGLVRAFVPVA